VAVQKLSTFSSVLIFSFFFKAVFGAEVEEVILNEIHWKGEEWIELKNLSQSDINLSGWRIENAKAARKPLVFPQEANFILPQNGYFLICDLQTSLPFCDFKVSISLNDDYSENGELILKDENEKVIDQTPPAQTSKWPAGGDGVSMERKFENEKPLPGGDLNSWQGNPFPSPQGSGVFLKADAGPNIVTFTNLLVTFDASASRGPIEKYIWNLGNGEIKEGKVITYSYSLSGKYFVSLKVIGQGKEDEDLIEVQVFPRDIFISEFDPREKWIEVVNEGENIEDLSGFEISTNSERGSGFIFPDGSFINKKTYLFLSPNILKNISFPNEGFLYLILPSGDIKQEIKYKIDQGVVAKKGEDYFYTQNPTPGQPNLVGILFQKENGKEKFYQEAIEPKFPLPPKKVLGEFFAQNPKILLFGSTSLIALLAGIYSSALLKLKKQPKKKERLEIEVEEVE